MVSEPKTKFRWGILGAARIAKKNWRAIGHSGNGTVTAVACRDPERGRRFIAGCQGEVPMAAVPELFDSYEALLASDKVDAVYIPLPTGLRKPWVIRAAEAGKHILCEKPCASNLADMEEMLTACRRHRVLFMDGVMFMHHPRLKRMRALLDDTAYFGEMTRVDSALCFCPAQPADYLAQDIRAHSVYEPLGCLGDVGWYTIRVSLWAANWRMPRQVAGRILAEHRRADAPAAVPIDFSGELLFDGGLSAGFHCSFRAWRQMWAMISGTRSNLYIPDFVVPADDDPLGNALSQQTNMVRNFAELARSGERNEFWPEIALQTQKVMMGCLESARGGGKLVTL